LLCYWPEAHGRHPYLTEKKLYFTNLMVASKYAKKYINKYNTTTTTTKIKKKKNKNLG